MAEYVNYTTFLRVDTFPTTSTTGGALIASSSPGSWQRFDGNPFWTLDGRQIFYPLENKIHTSPGDLSAESIFPGSQNPGTYFLRGLSPDGKKILIINQFGKIVVMNADGTGSFQLPTPFTVWWPQAEAVWSPDGTQIAFAARKPGQPYADIWVINADGTGLENITNTPEEEDYFPAWGKE